MKILHYMFGLPPVRDGGLVRYVLDLIEQEAKMGEDVRLLIPGAPALGVNRKTKILNSRTPYREIRTYEIYHPLPVPMCNGIRHPGLFMQTCGESAYRSFLRRLRPDLIHIHTFMGLQRHAGRRSRSCLRPMIISVSVRPRFCCAGTGFVRITNGKDVRSAPGKRFPSGG